jgi:serralysin
VWSSGAYEAVSTFLNPEDPYQHAMRAASMAAGAPVWSDVWNWVQGQASNVYDRVYDWVSDNVSGAPISIFSTLASIAPYGVPNVRFNIPTGIDPDVRALLTGSQWSGSSITYSLPDSRADYQAINPSADGYRSLTFETEQAIRHALEGYSPYMGGPRMGLTSVEGVTNLSLTYAGRDGGTIQVAGFNPNSTINRSHGYYPGVPIYGGDVWLNTYSKAPGSSSYQLVLHELGHALGLKHPHDSGGSLPKMSVAHDSPEYTVMSYNSSWNNPQTFMQYDVAALQELYGADFTTNSGNTVYSWKPQTGETFVNGVGQGTPFTNVIFLTIWDGGGTDTYDASAYSENARIDLAPGGSIKFSQGQLAYIRSNASAKGNVYNAFQYKGDARSLIENAIGGTGHDYIYGNATRNSLTGNGGNDALYGYDGNDTLTGGDGNDWLEGGAGSNLLDGGEGWDVVSYLNTPSARGGIVVNLSTNLNQGAALGDILVNVEVVQGTNANDVITGVHRGYGIELLGEGGNDVITGKAGHDTLNGGASDDTLVGGAGNDKLIGGFGNNILEGGADADVLDGTNGFSVAYYRNARSGVVVNLDGSGSSGDEAAGDTFIDVNGTWGSVHADRLVGNGSNNWMIGDGGNDTMIGGLGADTLYGSTGDDSLVGGDGDDTLYGESGNNILEGGAGADRLDGTNGNSVAYYHNARTAVSVNLSGRGHSGDQAEGDSLINIFNVWGSTHSDQLFGSEAANWMIGDDGHDLMFGWGGNDSLYGGLGDDLLDAGAGNNYLSGGGGRDRFYISPIAGASIIEDFSAEDDLLLSRSLFSDFTALKAFSYQSGGDVIIAKEAFSLTLKSFNLANLSAGNLLFV